MTNDVNSEHPIIVGVDGSGSALHAVRWAAREAVPNRTVTADVRDGQASDVLVAESRNAQLVVLGSRGLGGFGSRRRRRGTWWSAPTAPS